jgi:hypothetical protein
VLDADGWEVVVPKGRAARKAMLEQRKPGDGGGGKAAMDED